MRVAMRGSISRRMVEDGRVLHRVVHGHAIGGVFHRKVLLGSVRGYRWLGRGWVALQFLPPRATRARWFRIAAFVRVLVPWSWTGIALTLRRSQWCR